MRNDPDPQAGSSTLIWPRLQGRLALQGRPQRLLHNGLHDIGRGVLDPTRLLHLRLVLDLGIMILVQPDHLAQKLLIDLPQDLRRQHREGIGAVGEVELLDDLLQRAVIYLQAGGDGVRPVPARLRLEMKYPRVVALIRLLEQLKEPDINPLPLQQVLQAHVSAQCPGPRRCEGTLSGL